MGSTRSSEPDSGTAPGECRGAAANRRRPGFAAAVIVFLTGLSGCAEVGTPPGGPPDTTPPAIVDVFPESLATGVDTTARVRIVFSEKVDRKSLRDWTFVRPQRAVSSIDWDGPVATYRFRERLPVDTTISLLIGSGVVDRQGNPLGRPYRLTFSTGGSIAPGVIAGKLEKSRIPAAGKGETGIPLQSLESARPPVAGRTSLGPARFVWLFRTGRDSLPHPAVDDPDFFAEAEASDAYLVDGLPLDVPLILLAFHDGNRSRSFNPSTDFFTVLPETLVLTGDAPERRNLPVYLINPQAPGRVGGDLAAPADTAIVDTLAYGVLLSKLPEGGDTTGVAWPPARADRTAAVDAKRQFSFRDVPPGWYRIAAFIESKRDGRWVVTEPLGPPGIVRVQPAEETGGITIARPP